MGVKLFNTFEDFKPFIGSANINFDISTLESYVEDAITMLASYISQEQVDDLVSKFKSNSSDADYLKLLPKTRAVVSQFALLYWSIDSKLNISDAGLSRKEDEKSKSPYQWQSEEFKNARKETGWKRLHSLIVFLEANVNNYTPYKDSEERNWLTGRMVWKLSDFEKVRAVEGFETIVKLMPYLTKAEEDMIIPGITQEVFDELKDNPETETNKRARRHCINAIVNFAIYNAALDFPFRIGANGIFIDSMERGEQNYKKSSQNLMDIERLRMDCHKAKETALHLLVEFLDANCSDTVYPTYKDEILTPKVEAETTLNETRSRLLDGPLPII